jgi:hypothetical protein
MKCARSLNATGSFYDRCVNVGSDLNRDDALRHGLPVHACARPAMRTIYERTSLIIYTILSIFRSWSVQTATPMTAFSSACYEMIESAKIIRQAIARIKALPAEPPLPPKG